MHLRPRSSSRAGFTLVELMIVMALIAMLAAIVVPPWTQYRTRLNANAAAQGIRSELVRIQAYSIAMEQECYLVIDSATQYSVYQAATTTAGARPVKRISVAGQNVSLSPVNGRIVFGARGWVDTGVGKTNITGTSLPSSLGGFTVYSIEVAALGTRNAQNTPQIYRVQTYGNGRVQIQ